MKQFSRAVDEIVENCLAVRVRLIGRTITGVYDHALEPHGLTVAQANLIAALGKIGTCAPTKLGDLLQLDRSTVSRNLQLLFRNGWVREVSSDEKGVREVTLTRAGREKISSILADWRHAQESATKLLGADGVRAVRAIASELSPIPNS